MQMRNFFQRLFGGSKEKRRKRTIEFYAKLSLQLTIAYQELIESALTKKNTSLIRGGPNLTVDLSAEGVEYLANNLPSSVIDVLRQEQTEIIVDAGFLARALLDNPSQGGLQLNPTVNELMFRVLDQEARRRFVLDLSRK
jgi:hypothetical protein